MKRYESKAIKQVEQSYTLVAPKRGRRITGLSVSPAWTKRTCNFVPQAAQNRFCIRERVACLRARLATQLRRSTCFYCFCSFFPETPIRLDQRFFLVFFPGGRFGWTSGFCLLAAAAWPAVI